MKPGRETCTLHVRNAIDAIGPATEQAEAWMADQRVSADASYLVSLAIEELVTNCIKYGYDDTAEHIVDIVLSVEDASLTMEVVDDGHAFNPLAAPPPDLSLSLEDRPLGGLGIHLLRELADKMTYERRDGTNRLVLMKQMH
jgi:anti-sigma regulatory factor (Ser/Thr protein kinase)